MTVQSTFNHYFTIGALVSILSYITMILIDYFC